MCLPARCTLAIRFPSSVPAMRRADDLSGCFLEPIQTDSTISPVTCLFRPRATVSTSGSSGTIQEYKIATSCGPKRPSQSFAKIVAMGTDSPERFHYLLMREVIETGHAPTLEKLSSLAELGNERTEAVLRTLERMHGVILVPNSTRIWSLHPFALNPTAFWVRTANGGWWANCAWCSLGIHAALQEDVNIATFEGGEGKPLDFAVEAGKASHAELLMHFPYPPECWWDNPFAPCANILFFASESHIDSWCSRHGHPRGSVFRIDQ